MHETESLLVSNFLESLSESHFLLSRPCLCLCPKRNFNLFKSLNSFGIFIYFGKDSPKIPFLMHKRFSKKLTSAPISHVATILLSFFSALFDRFFINTVCKAFRRILCCRAKWFFFEQTGTALHTFNILVKILGINPTKSCFRGHQ